MTVLDDVLRAAVPDAGAGRVRPTRYPYTTSAPLYELAVDRDGGLRTNLLLKDLSWAALTAEARSVKPRLLHDPAREIGVYREVLPLAPNGPPRCLLIVDDDLTGRRWLLLEHVVGRELYQHSDLDPWRRAAAWFGRFHARLAEPAEALAARLPLLRHDADFLQMWLARAVRNVGPEALRPVVAVFPALLERILGQPRSVVHGEAYASNVLVAGDRVCAVDWETAAIGPCLVDLACLTAGRGWAEADRLVLCEAYLGAPPDAEFLRDLDACRLQLALQWLGWSSSWQAPAEHAQDWLGEALRLAERFGDA